MIRNSPFRITTIICLAGILGLFSGCFKNLTQKYLMYSNDFENNDLKGLEAYDSSGQFKKIPIVDFNGSKVLGRFNNNTIILTFFNLPTHNSIQVEFTLYIHDKWDGDYLGPTHVPDIWQMSADHNPLLLTTFSNNPANLQSYPASYQYANVVPVPAKTSAEDPNLKGVCALQDISGGTTSYKIVKIFPHSLSNFTFSCNDALQPYNSLCLKSWSIDNLTITAIKY